MQRSCENRRLRPAPSGPTARRRAVVYAETIEHLTQLADDAYALARAEVFDAEPPGTGPKRRTWRQRALVAKLELIERELEEARRGREARAG